MERLGLSQPGTSKHLRILREAGLVRVRPEAQRRVYELAPAPLAELADWLAPYRAFWEQRLDALGRHLDDTGPDASRSAAACGEHGPGRARTPDRRHRPTGVITHVHPDRTYEQTDGRPLVRFERTFPHPVAAVWRSITDPARLEQWFPTTVEFVAAERRASRSSFVSPSDDLPADGRESSSRSTGPGDWCSRGVTIELTFELAERDGGAACRLAFSVVLDGAGKAARDAPGGSSAWTCSPSWRPARRRNRARRNGRLAGLLRALQGGLDFPQRPRFRSRIELL